MAKAAGASFLHWKGTGAPIRILYVDGEMSERLLRARLGDAVRRLGYQPSAFHPLNRFDFPEMPPLNTEEGGAFINVVIDAIGGIDEIIFDNVQALTTGDQREEVGWNAILPWIRSLTLRKIGQIWAHHTGHENTRSYGTKTREWQMDTVILMEPVDRPDADIAFSLKFTKARERRPDNRADFEPAIIILSGDSWSSERGIVGTTKRTKKDRVLEILEDAIARHGEVPPANQNIPPDTPCVTEKLWRERCEMGCISEGSPDSMARGFRRNAKALLDVGRVRKWKPWVWIVR
jgi:hypothetical protein